MKIVKCKIDGKTNNLEAEPVSNNRNGWLGYRTEDHCSVHSLRISPNNIGQPVKFFTSGHNYELMGFKLVGER